MQHPVAALRDFNHDASTCVAVCISVCRPCHLCVTVLLLRFSASRERAGRNSSTGTPLIEEFADKMPFTFTGELDKLAIMQMTAT